MKPKESEKTLEARLVREIEARGGMALKYTSQFHRGIPDRICLLPGGVVVFVELKSTGRKPTKLQQHAIKELRSLGFDCWVIDRPEEMDRMLKTIDWTREMKNTHRGMRESADEWTKEILEFSKKVEKLSQDDN